MVKYLTTEQEYTELVFEQSEKKLVVVDFTASWCPPCRMIAPVLEKMAEENPSVAFFKVDVDEADEVMALVNISCMPTFKFYKNGEEVAELMGADANKLQALVQKHA